MAGTDTAVVRLSDLVDGQEAECFAALVRKERGTDKYGRPYLKCQFRDKRATMVAPLWFANPLREPAESWVDGVAAARIDNVDTLPPSGYSMVHAGHFSNGPSDEAIDVWTDELVVSTAPIACDP